VRRNCSRLIAYGVKCISRRNLEGAQRVLDAAKQQIDGDSVIAGDPDIRQAYSEAVERLKAVKPLLPAALL
jgi:hypothetical protein